ncbi:sulfite exporter TauE/SafE family protein [Roseococcus sp. YIM B11640]|uniref:sulfite exporter TauE/SafE family protein n=1 Tax=Roseococcus sp. YIM B11640 TaxID=3133973 RepID=UPI003C797ABD
MDHWLWLAGLAAAMGATGLLSGLLAGLFGVGGGIVIVPVLFYILPLFDVPTATQMKVAVATSLATIIPTSIVSARKHWAKGAIDMPLLKSLALPIFVGVLIGTALAVVLKGPGLTLVFATVALLVAINMGFTDVAFRIRDSMPFGILRQVIGIAIGAISAMMGIGGGTVGVPVLGMFGTPIRSAVATSSAFGIIISIPATIGLILMGIGADGRPPYSLGWVNLIGFALIVPGSILATPWGVSLAHSISPTLLKRAFAVFLAFTSLRMFYSLFF